MADLSEIYDDNDRMNTIIPHPYKSKRKVQHKYPSRKAFPYSMMNDESYELLKQMIRENPHHLNTCGGVYRPKTNESKIKPFNGDYSSLVRITNGYIIKPTSST